MCPQKAKCQAPAPKVMMRQFQNGDIVTVASGAIFEPAHFTPHPTAGQSQPPLSTPSPYPRTEDSLLKRLTRPYSRKYKPAYSLSLYGARAHTHTHTAPYTSLPYVQGVWGGRAFNFGGGGGGVDTAPWLAPPPPPPPKNGSIDGPPKILPRLTRTQIRQKKK